MWEPSCGTVALVVFYFVIITTEIKITIAATKWHVACYGVMKNSNNDLLLSLPLPTPPPEFQMIGSMLNTCNTFPIDLDHYNILVHISKGTKTYIYACI